MINLILKLRKTSCLGEVLHRDAEDRKDRKTKKDRKSSEKDAPSIPNEKYHVTQDSNPSRKVK